MTKNRRLALLTNTVLFLLEVRALWSLFNRDGIAMFRFYTECSNALAALAALACLICAVVSQNSGNKKAYQLACKLKFFACCTQLMTFVVVTLVLAPMICAAGGDGYYEMFVTGNKPITHFFGPVLTLASYLAFESHPLPTKRDSRYALAFTFAYAVVAYTCNYLHVFVGPYPFLQVWDMPLWQTLMWFVILLFVAWGLAQVPRVLAKKLAARTALTACYR